MPIFRVHLEYITSAGIDVREPHDVVASTPHEAGLKAKAIVRPHAKSDSIFVRKVKLLRGE